ncbi:unnamed protein product [Rotaria sordida]|uniref:DNA-directed primase/polymerase protein n=1 Tax=Rotaria sordida TaxID=392033 RepID=A0A819VEA3_9BILA|nr:unnamed protein product [Rotaria sordida]CAF4107442.1 unnamed protein product [Rotaria sordida]
MDFIQNLIKKLFPHNIITHHINDLTNEPSDQNNITNDICISIEKENKSRQFCRLTIEQLTTLFEHCPVSDRTLYEVISLSKPVKAYIDYEYFIDKNLDIENHYIGPISSLKILYYFLNIPNDAIDTIEIYTQKILKQFLILQASTNEKISYHFIHSKPSVLFENVSTLGIFLKAIIHFLLFSIIQHKCTMFNINSPPEPCTISNLIQILAPYVSILRKHCTSCTISIPYVSIADISYLLVRSAADKWITAIDINVYSKNQQFRLFNSVKYGKNNPLIPSTTFPFDSSLQYSFSDILKKSLITLIENHQIPKIYFKNKNFIIHFPPYSNSNSTTTIPQNLLNIKIINDHRDHSYFLNLDINTNTNQNSSSSLHPNQSNKLDLSIPDVQIFITFVQNIITSDPSHQGYIHSCIRGTYNKSLLFFNIAGHYKYCPKKKDHHQHNNVAIIINSKTYTYSIRCKDPECNNTILSWKKIK